MKCSLFHYSCSKIAIIPVQKISLFRYSRKTKAIIPLQKFPLFLFHYSSSPPNIYKVSMIISVNFFSSSFFILADLKLYTLNKAWQTHLNKGIETLVNF